VLNLLGQWAGPRAELDAWLAPIRAVAKADPKRYRIETLPDWDAQAILSEEGAPRWSYERSRYVKDDLAESAIARIFERLKALLRVGVSANGKGYLTGGAISDVAPDATAFVHRDDWLLSTFNPIWTAQDTAQSGQGVLAGLEWLDAAHDATSPYTAQRSYQNFVDPSQTDRTEADYGQNLARLVDVKRKFDPTNTFHFEQSIPMAI
jgi:FAD/FMN-containing dehydrogenase